MFVISDGASGPCFESCILVTSYIDIFQIKMFWQKLCLVSLFLSKPMSTHIVYGSHVLKAPLAQGCLVLSWAQHLQSRFAAKRGRLLDALKACHSVADWATESFSHSCNGTEPATMKKTSSQPKHFSILCECMFSETETSSLIVNLQGGNMRLF